MHCSSRRTACCSEVGTVTASWRARDRALDREAQIVDHSPHRSADLVLGRARAFLPPHHESREHVLRVAGESHTRGGSARSGWRDTVLTSAGARHLPGGSSRWVRPSLSSRLSDFWSVWPALSGKRTRGRGSALLACDPLPFLVEPLGHVVVAARPRPLEPHRAVGIPIPEARLCAQVLRKARQQGCYRSGLGRCPTWNTGFKRQSVSTILLMTDWAVGFRVSMLQSKISI